MSSEEIAISVRGVSKHYLMFDRPEDRLKQMVVPRLQRLLGREPRRYYRDFAALHGVSFDVRRGETIGIVGRNGSGKSTLLQIICGTLQPTAGEVEVRGRIAALLELGAGFNPEFTGRENVYLNAAILGIPRAEVDARFDDIARFADIGHFIDQPVKTYSSGMYVRLAFATAISVDPDILVVDEALAVGDEAFQRKCYARIEEIKARGGTILFVSHDAQTIVQLCARALLFDAGELLLSGKPKVVISQYQRLVNLTGEEAQEVREQIRGSASLPAAVALPDGAVPSPGTAVADGADRRAEVPASLEGFDPGLVSRSRIEHERHGVSVSDVRLLNSHGERVNVLETGKRYLCRYDVEFDDDCEDVGFGIGIRTVNGFSFGGANLEALKERRLARVPSCAKFTLDFEFTCNLLAGNYFINTGVLGNLRGTRRYLNRITDALHFRVAAQDNGTAGGCIDFGIQLTVRKMG